MATGQGKYDKEFAARLEKLRSVIAFTIDELKIAEELMRKTEAALSVPRRASDPEA